MIEKDDEAMKHGSAGLSGSRSRPRITCQDCVQKENGNQAALNHMLHPGKGHSHNVSHFTEKRQHPV